MTCEEAAEVILAGGFFENCRSCQGSGFEQSGIVLEILCLTCRGMGSQHCPSYLEACSVLELEPARLPLMGVARGFYKSINFGRAYGMGPQQLRTLLQQTIDFHADTPFNIKKP